MTIEDYISTISALILVLAMMGLIAIAFKKLNDKGGNFLTKSNRLSITEQKMIDTKNKLVLIRRDDVEHLVILSQNSQTVVETNIQPQQSVTPRMNKKDIPLES